MKELHELLACLDDIKKTSNAIQIETYHTFNSKQEHFDGMIKTYSAYDENSKDLIEPVYKKVVETVSDKIKYTAKSIARTIDAELSLDETNCSGVASAELTCGGISFGTFSASSLLDLDKQLTKIKEMYRAIPTLDNTKTWAKDDTIGINILTTPEEVKYRAVKELRTVVKYPATKEHPAQVELVNDNVQVGVMMTTYKSGRISSSAKSMLLEKIDDLIVAVKVARSKANKAPIANITVGKKIFDFINSGVL